MMCSLNLHIWPQSAKEILTLSVATCTVNLVSLKVRHCFYSSGYFPFWMSAVKICGPEKVNLQVFLEFQPEDSNRHNFLVLTSIYTKQISVLINQHAYNILSFRYEVSGVI